MRGAGSSCWSVCVFETGCMLLVLMLVLSPFPSVARGMRWIYAPNYIAVRVCYGSRLQVSGCKYPERLTPRFTPQQSPRKP